MSDQIIGVDPAKEGDDETAYMRQLQFRVRNNDACPFDVDIHGPDNVPSPCWRPVEVEVDGVSWCLPHGLKIIQRAVLKEPHKMHTYVPLHG